MNLKTQLTETLTELQKGERVNRRTLIGLLEATRDQLSDTDAIIEPSTVQKEDDPVEYTREENTPTRLRISNWNLSDCKRCLKTGAPDGSIIVRIFGVGWWHDECYRVVNPAFYVGL